MVIIPLAVIVPASAVVMKRYYRRYVSAFIERYSTTPLIVTDVVRNAFDSTVVPTVRPVPNHTHANAAAFRTSATRFARLTAAYCGSEIFSIEMSASDQRHGIRGTRQWYWAKDTKVHNTITTPRDSDIIYICDVDFYMDMPQFLVEHDQPVLLYTPVPEQASSIGEDDTTFFFNEKGEFVTFVSGGGTYTHHLWNYNTDSITVSCRPWYFPWMTTVYKTYAIERKQITKHRQVVLLSPIRKFTGIFAQLAEWIVKIQPLTRFDPLVVASNGEKFIRFGVHKNTGTEVTIGRPNQHLSATVPATTFDAVCTVARTNVTRISKGTVESWLDQDKPAAAMLTEYLLSTNSGPMPYVFPVSESVRKYDFKTRQVLTPGEAKLTPFMSPFIHAAYTPVPNKEGEERCVEGRIKSLRAPEPPANNFRDQCLEEFARLVVGDSILAPVEEHDVLRQQSSATQTASILRASMLGPFLKPVLKCFIKAEAYSGLKDPRNISTYNDKHKLDMSKFTMALAAHLKQFAWYGPGKTPKEIAERVADICSRAKVVNISDYHRMDGTISYVMRQVERIIFMRAFKYYRTQLNDLLEQNAGNIGYLPHGTTFDQGPSHGSGSPDTSVSQTLRATFTSYLGFRHSVDPDTGNYYTPEKAFKSLGIHLGDDGVDPDLSVASHQWAAEKVGLILEAAIVPRGNRGVNFLARFYSPNVWFGCPDSMCDVKRQLSKFHVSQNLPTGVTPVSKLVEKCMSYAATDGNTPVIGEYTNAVLDCVEFRPRKLAGVGSYWSRFNADTQFPNENVGGWMDVEFEIQLPNFDRQLFNNWLTSTKTATEFLRPPLCQEIETPAPAKRDVILDGDLVRAVTPPPSVPIPALSREETSESPKGKITVHNHERSGNVRRASKFKQIGRKQKKTRIGIKSAEEAW